MRLTQTTVIDSGYAKYDGVFDRSTMLQTLAALAAADLQRTRAGARHVLGGPLRVLPDTHRRGVLPDEEVERLAFQMAAVECTTMAGGVIAMRPLTIHASSKSIDDQPRRVLHIEYADSVKLCPHIELALV